MKQNGFLARPLRVLAGSSQCVRRAAPLGAGHSAGAMKLAAVLAVLAPGSPLLQPCLMRQFAETQGCCITPP